MQSRPKSRRMKLASSSMSRMPGSITAGVGTPPFSSWRPIRPLPSLSRSSTTGLIDGFVNPIMGNCALYLFELNNLQIFYYYKSPLVIFLCLLKQCHCPLSYILSYMLLLSTSSSQSSSISSSPSLSSSSSSQS